MRKLHVMFAITGLAALSFTSCEKPAHQPAIEKTVTVELATNEAYTFVLPQSQMNDAYEFSSQASHFSVSQLGKNALGQQIYQYTPAFNYEGADEVIVCNDHREPGHSECGHHGGDHFGECTGGGNGGMHGGCDGQNDHYRVTIHFQVGSTNSTLTK
jgi:hypothetical protein